MTDQTAAEPETIARLYDGVFPAMAMLAGMRLDVFTALKDGPAGVDEIARAIGVGAEKLAPLLYALVAAGLLEVKDGRFCNGAEADRFLVRGRPGFIGGKHEMYAEDWNAALRTAESIRTGRAQAPLDYAAMSEDELDAFYRLIHAGALTSGRELASRVDLSSRRALLDVGGGSGGNALALCEAYPRLSATVADLPVVTPITRRYVAEADAVDRIAVVDADLLIGPPPGRYDVAVLSAFVQIFAPAEARRALSNVGQALEPGGAIYIKGAGIIDDSRTTPPNLVTYAIVYLNNYDGGRAYTEGEYRTLLSECGFAGVERLRLDDGRSIICARKAG